MKKLLVILLLSITIISVGQDKVLLRLNYEKDDIYETSMLLTQKMGEGIMSMDTKMTIVQEVKSVSEKEFQSDVKVTEIVMNISQSGMNMSYDSNKKEAELDESEKMMKIQMDPILKAITSLRSDKLGNVIETNVTPNTPGTSDLIKQSSNVIYPEKAVSIGDTWSMDKEEKGLKFIFTYNVVSITVKNVLLDISGNVDGEAMGNITGSMIIDKNSGVLSTSKLDMFMKVQGQDLKTTITINTIKK